MSCILLCRIIVFTQAMKKAKMNLHNGINLRVARSPAVVECDVLSTGRWFFGDILDLHMRHNISSLSIK